MLAGAPTVRPAETAEDWLMVDVALFDVFGQRYGWTVDQYEKTPRVYLDRLPSIWKLQRQRTRAGSNAVEAQNLAQKLLADKAKGRW